MKAALFEASSFSRFVLVTAGYRPTGCDITELLIYILLTETQ